MSEQVMTQARAQTAQAKPAGGLLQRAAITPVAHGILQRCSNGVECPECRESRLQREGTLQRAADNEAPAPAVPPIVHDVLGSPWQPLHGGTRAFMEPRFGHDFSGVRVHTDARAAESARAVNALAYTVGRDVVFGVGQYAPESVGGRRLLAHELTHVVQQDGASKSNFQGKLTVNQSNDVYEMSADHIANLVMTSNEHVTISPALAQPSIQRSCGRNIGVASGCIGIESEPNGTSFLFNVNCDDFKSGEQSRLEKDFVPVVTADDVLEIHGFASEEGSPSFNENLSCARAEKARAVLTNAGLSVSQIRALYKHGATPGLRTERRSVVITKQSRSRVEPEPENCSSLVGNCDFYLCRDRKNPCAERGYYRGYGHKYCERFSQQTRPHMTTTGKEWLDCTLRCLQEHVNSNIPENTPCQEVKKGAYASHSGCYVRCGLCSLPPGDLDRIMNTIDSEDLDTSQVIESIGRCLTFPNPPATPGFQLECVMRLGGCPVTRSGGVPEPEDIERYNKECRQHSGYTGPDVTPSSEDCRRFFGPGEPAESETKETPVR